MYVLTIVSSSTTVEAKYPRVQNTSPVKFCSRPPKRPALAFALLPLICPTTFDAACLADACVNAVSHHEPFFCLRFIVLHQLPEYLSKVLAQHSDYSLFALLRHRYYTWYLRAQLVWLQL